jgi:FdhE protein
MPTPIITDGTMDRVLKAPKVVLPKSGSRLFADRANRMNAIAATDDSGAYMRFLGHICRGQAKAFDARVAQRVSERAVSNSREHGMPPLSALVFPRDAAWRDDLRDIADALASAMTAPSPQLTTVIASLRQSLAADATDLESMADRLIAGASLDEDAPFVPFVGAALQVYFSRMAQGLEADDIGACDVATVCPCCGMRPTASLVRIDPDRMNYRYLVCSLCMTEWNMERVKCTSCESEKGVAYLSIEAEGVAPAQAAVQAETCDECKTYLKLFLQEKDPLVDPIADDLNTLVLDMLTDEKGYARTGPNLLFYPGSP